MSVNKHEWTGNADKACNSSYTTLGCYLGKGTMAPLSASTSTGFIVPDYAAIGYDALTGKDGGNGCGYFTIDQAYNRDPTHYKTRACGGCNPPNGYRPNVPGSHGHGRAPVPGSHGHGRVHVPGSHGHGLAPHPHGYSPHVPAHLVPHGVPAHLVPHGVPAHLVPHGVPAHLVPHGVPAHHASGGYSPHVPAHHGYLPAKPHHGLMPAHPAHQTHFVDPHGRAPHHL
jgi:hypothetical protein